MGLDRAHRWYWILLGAVVALGLPGACQKDTPVEPSGGSDLRVARLEVDRTVLAPGDSTRVRAWVVQGPEPGSPVDGEPVVFSELVGSSGGTFSKSESVTDVQGWASSVYRPSPSDSGRVTLRVSAGASVRYAVLEIADGDPNGVQIAFSTPGDATSLPADGRSEVAITLTATQGAQRAPVSELPIVLTAGDRFVDRNGNGIFDAGDALDPTGDRDGDGAWDPEGALPESATTDAAGQARFTYRAGSTVGTVYVRATGGGVSRELELYQHPLSLQIDLHSGARELLADGVSDTWIQARVRDWSGVAIGGVLVKFVAGEPFTDLDGDGFFDAGTETFDDANQNGRWDSIGEITSVVATTSDGIAVARYEAGLIVGDVTIRATTTAGSAEALVRLVAVPPAQRIDFELPVERLYADGESSLEGRIEVRDLNGIWLAGKTVRLSAGERFDDRNGDGVFTAGTDILLDDRDANGAWTPMGSVPETVVTGSDGTAAFEFAAGLATGPAWIRAAVDGVSSETRVDLDPLPATYAIEVEAAFERLTVVGGGGAEQTLLTATCYRSDGARVPAGVPVSFSIVSGPGGGERLDGAIGGAVAVLTDNQGRATATLRAGDEAGLVQVGAMSGSVLGSAGVYISAGLAASISCGADSVSLSENGNCRIYAYVYDQAHNAVRDGTVVLFTADEGFIDGEGGEGWSMTESGIATATFVAIPDPSGDGVAEIVAETNGGSSGGVTCTTYIQLPREPGAVNRITLQPTEPEIAVRGTGGVEQTRIRAQAFDRHNRAVGPDRSITFEITQGPGGGEHFLDSGSTVVAITDAVGVAEAVLASGTISGTVVVTARPTGLTAVSEHTAIGIAAGPPAHIAVGVEDCNVLTCNIVNADNPVVVVVSDVYRNPVRDGTVIYFTTSDGMVVGNQGLGTAITERGLAAGMWRSDGGCGIITVSASTLGGTLANHASFIGSGYAYSAEFVQPATPSVSLTADGSTELTLKVLVLDANGLFVEEGNEVEIEAIYGEITGEEPTADGCNASLARATYTTPVLERDDSYTIPDDGVGAIDLVTVTGGFGPVGDQIEIELRTGRASAAKSAIDLGNVPPGAASVFSVTIHDGKDNPLGGHLLELTATAGEVDTTAVTDAYGMAGGLTFIAPESTGNVTIEVRDLDPNYGGIIIRKSIAITY